MQKLSDRLVVWLCQLVALLPFWLIYLMSDIFYVLIYHVFRYRRKVVNQNLVNSFPEKSKAEIRQITKKFYHHLADLGLETLKYSRMTEKELDERLTMHKLEIMNDCFDQGKSVILLNVHYGNWEWCLSIQRYLHAQFLIVYNPMRNNKAFEDFLIRSRNRFGSESIPVHQSARVAMSLNKAEKPAGLALAADQTPPRNAQFWTTFLNQETAFFPGPMKISAKTNQPVIIQYALKTRRGHYDVFNEMLIEKPADHTPEEIMLAYVNRVEEIIRAQPEYWLWSHRRWKHKRPAGVQLHER